MKVNKLTISYSNTVQMRQFEPVTIFVSAEVQVNPGDTVERVFQNVKKKLREQVDDEIHKLKVERKESFAEEGGLDKTV